MTKTFTIAFFLFLFLIALISCKESKKEPYQLLGNAINLIAGTSGKTWKIVKRLNNDVRMNMGDCFLSYRQTYHPDMHMNDNNGAHPDCGETLEATWEITKNKKGFSFIKLQSEQLPKLMNIKEDYNYFQILEITEDKLTVAYKHRQFSNQWMWITDFYVPEDRIVEGRNFHNK